MFSISRLATKFQLVISYVFDFKVRESAGEECDMTLKNNIEGIIIKWAYQSDEVIIFKKWFTIHEICYSPCKFHWSTSPTHNHGR